MSSIFPRDLYKSPVIIFSYRLQLDAIVKIGPSWSWCHTHGLRSQPQVRSEMDLATKQYRNSSFENEASLLSKVILPCSNCSLLFFYVTFPSFSNLLTTVVFLCFCLFVLLFCSSKVFREIVNLSSGNNSKRLIKGNVLRHWVNERQMKVKTIWEYFPSNCEQNSNYLKYITLSGGQINSMLYSGCYFIFSEERYRASLVAQTVKYLLWCRRPGFNPWIGQIPWRRHGNPLQYSYLENSKDRGAWWATVHGVTKSWTGLSK